MADIDAPEDKVPSRKPRANLTEVLDVGSIRNGGPLRPPRPPEVELEENPVIQVADDGSLKVPEDVAQRVQVIDNLFADFEPVGSAPVALPVEPTEESKKATAAESKRRVTAITKGHRRSMRDAQRIKDPAKRKAVIKRADDYRAELMVLNCIKPLTQNVGPSELLEAATTMAVLWSLSKRVRTTMDGYADKVHDALRYNREDLRARMGKMSLASTPEEKKLATRKIEQAERSLMAQTDAVLHSEHMVSDLDGAVNKVLGMDEGLYRNLRSGMSVEEARAIYNESMDDAVAEWTADGLDLGEIKAAVRDQIALEGAEDPEVFARYVNTFSGNVYPGPRSADGSWDGRWISPRLGYLDASGLNLFPVRAPLDPDQYIIQMSETAELDFARAATRGPEALADVLRGYEAGPSLIDYKVDEGVVGGPGLSEQHKLGIERFRSMAAAMTDDGIHPDLRQACLGSGAARGWKAFCEANPEHAATFAAKYPDGIGRDETSALVETVKGSAAERKLVPLFSSNETVNQRLSAWEANKKEQGITLPRAVLETGREEFDPPEVDESGRFDLPKHPSRSTEQIRDDKAPVIPKVGVEESKAAWADIDKALSGAKQSKPKAVIPKAEPEVVSRSEPTKKSGPTGPEL